MSLCAVFMLCGAVQHAEPLPRLVLPGVNQAALRTDLAMLDGPQPNVVMVAIALLGAVAATANAIGDVTKCASNTQCTQTIDRWGAKLASFGRRIVGADPGAGVETITVRVGHYDADGDGDDDYVVDSWAENGYDRLHEFNETWAGYYADIDDEAQKQHAWLVAQGR